jgi:uncharacterized protein (DUF1501 family)
MNSEFSRSRRHFLRNAATSSLACMTGGAVMTQFGLINAALAAGSGSTALASSDYRALVCLYLYGGNDSFNMLIPTDGTRYPVYRNSRSVMALDSATLNPITVRNAHAGESYGLHPSCPEMAQLFNQGNAGFAVNVGTALQPITKTQYNAASYPRPPQLFSHADQTSQWQNGQPIENARYGWGGQAADRLHVMNGGQTVPMSISLSGQNRYQNGAVVQPYTIGAAGPTALSGYSSGNSVGAAKLSALEDLLASSYPDPMSRTYALQMRDALSYYNTMSSALAGAAPLSTVFPATGLGAALNMIAKVMSVRNVLNVKRQIFYVSLGSFDTHDAQLTTQASLLAAMSQALAAFYSATVELGVASNVTTFTMSEFSRTISPNSDGTDHAWAGNHFVMGGAVKGGNLFGTPAASGGIFPDLTLNGPDCLSRGQMMPATSCDQYSASLARWMGVQNTDIATIFPYVNNFVNQSGNSTWDLGMFA